MTAAVAPLLLLAWYATGGSEDPRFRTSLYSKVPLSERSLAMGASDASWSPDGKEVAFSMFGSIWRMSAGGGIARQITAGTGYDAGAAWSPDGRSIAFIRGSHPIRGIQLGTQGELMTADAGTGDVKLLSAGTQFTGTPAWIPDSKAVVANRVEGNDIYLSEVQVNGSGARRINGQLYSRVTTQMQRGNGWFYYWYPVAVGPWGELAFGGDRDGTGQLWRMPLTDGLVLTQKLTNYPEKSQAEVQDVAWENRDSIVYSANLNNDRTNYDLWRWQKGKVKRITTSIHDEFSPRISPDGATILFVSNYLGNLDLFTTTPDVSEAKHLRIGPLQFRRSTAHLRVRVEDEGGNPIAARVSVRAADGKHYAPAGALMRYHAGMGNSAGFFHAQSGEFALDVPAGSVRISAYHGLEYEPAVIEAEAGKDGAPIKVTVKRQLHWQGNGWWSGEDHIHANYAGPYYLRPADAMAMAEAEDLNISNLLAANAEGERVYDREFFEGRPNQLSKSQYILYWNEEFRNRIVYGHMVLLNLTRLIDPVYTSFAGTPHPWDYPSNTMVASEARRAKAVVGYVHPIVGQTRDPFDFTVSAKELPVTAALGFVDLIDVYPWGPVALEIWYDLLNCGLRIAPGAGTDTFANWRSINQVPGASRVYVKVPGDLSYPEWITGLRKGRSFVTNGPLLELTVNGKTPGETVSSADRLLQLNITARAESRVPLERLELVLNGKVVRSFAVNTASRASFEVTLPVMESGWMALRAAGIADPAQLGAPAQAHTAAIYVEVNGKPMKPMPEPATKFVQWIDRLTQLVEMRNNFEKPEQKEQVLQLLRRGREFYDRQATLGSLSDGR